MNPIVISIMTVPSDKAREFIMAKSFEPDANLSPVDKPPKAITEIKGDALREKRLIDWKFAQGIKLEQSVLTKRQQAVEQAGRKWWTARLVCWSIAPIGVPPISMSGAKEKPLLTKLFELLTDKYPTYYLMAKGGGDFALPFLTGRAMALDIGLPPQLVSHYPSPDIHGLFGRTQQSTQRGTMEDYAFGVGLKLPEYGDSPQYLFDQYQLGNENALEQMQHGCNAEVQIIGELMRRARKAFPPAAKAGDSEVPF